jgi:hypothetical protein
MKCSVDLKFISNQKFLNSLLSSMLFKLFLTGIKSHIICLQNILSLIYEFNQLMNFNSAIKIK